MEPVADIQGLSRCTVLDPQGNPVALPSLWRKQTAILVFLRHFACLACRDHALQVWGKRQSLEGGGAKIHFIGNGRAEMIESFKVEHGMAEASFFTDPTLETFRAAGFRRGFWVAEGPLTNKIRFVARAVQHSITQPQTGDVWQLGGVLVVKPGGAILYQFISEVMGHFPPAQDDARIAATGELT